MAPQSSRNLPGSSQKLPEAPLAQALCLSCSTEEGQELPHWKDFVLLMLHREVPKGAQTHSAHSAHRSSSQCSLEKTTVLPMLILNNNVL